MLKNVTLAGTVAGLLLLASGGLTPSAAQPLAKPAIEKSQDVVQVRREGGGGFRSGGGGFGGNRGALRSGGGFGGNRAFHGGGERHFNHGGNHGAFLPHIGRPHAGGHQFRPRHHRRFFGHGFYAPPVYSYYSGDECYWLKRRAVRTGSLYWWRRYEECRWG